MMIGNHSILFSYTFLIINSATYNFQLDNLGIIQ